MNKAGIITTAVLGSVGVTTAVAVPTAVAVTKKDIEPQKEQFMYTIVFVKDGVMWNIFKKKNSSIDIPNNYGEQLSTTDEVGFKNYTKLLDSLSIPYTVITDTTK